jgi:tight adherence protein B
VVIGPAFLLLALLTVAVAAYLLLLERGRALAVLDRRIALRTETIAGPVIIRRRQPLRMPDYIAPVLAQAQIEPTPRLIGTVIALFVLAFAATLSFAGPGLALACLVAMAFGLVSYVRARARKRIDKLIDALPFYLDGVRQLMAVGNSLSQALLKAMPGSAPIVQSFLGPAARRIELGAPVGDSIQQLAEKLAVPEIAMLSAAVRVNIKFGGAMTSILANLAGIVRERLRIKRELASATSETRVSTMLLIGLPLIVIAILLSSNEAYRAFFLHDPRGHRLAIIAAVLQTSGIAIMMRMARLKF